MGFRSTEPQPVEEKRTQEATLPLWSHSDWAGRFPWLLQGTTDRSTDFGLFGRKPSREVIDAWLRLRAMEGVRTAVHSRQVHGAEVREWRQTASDAFVLVDGSDAHVTAETGVLLTISIADCVPVFMVVEEPRVICLAHAGWRGAAAGVLGRSLDALLRLAGNSPSSVWLHCGPAICGSCYEVGPEVHAALRPDSPAPERPQPIDLRRVLTDSALNAGLLPSRISVSSLCTRCTGETFHSHRRGDPGRQIALLAIKG